MTSVEQHLQILGQNMVDVVTGFEGMVECLSFDAYGCVQATLRPHGLNDKREVIEARWFDVKRLKPKGKRVMVLPPFVPPGQEIGAADKPARA